MIKFSKIVLTILIIAVVIIITLLWLRENDLFVLNRVKVIGNNLLTDEEIIELADIDFSREIFYVDLDAIAEKLLTHPLIQNVSVSRYLPSAVKIKVEEKDLIATAPGSKLHVLDSEGEIIKTNRLVAFYDLPIITGAAFKTDSTDNKVASPTMHEMVRILKAIRLINFQLYHDISEIHYDKRCGIVLYLRKRGLSIIIGVDDYSRKICYLSTIYNLLRKRNELSTVKTIDVRYEKQVVVKS